MRAAALPLASLEVAVGRRRTAFSWLQLVGVHAKAHRATRAAPLAASLLEDHVQAFLLGLQPNAHGPRYDEQPGVLVNLTTSEDLGCSAQVLDAPVRARTDEDGVHSDVPHRCACIETHVLQGLLRGDLVALLGEVRRSGHARSERNALARVRAPR